MKIRPVGTVIPCGRRGQKDGQTDMKKLIVAFRNIEDVLWANRSYSATDWSTRNAFNTHADLRIDAGLPKLQTTAVKNFKELHQYVHAWIEGSKAIAENRTRAFPKALHGRWILLLWDWLLKIKTDVFGMNYRRISTSYGSRAAGIWKVRMFLSFARNTNRISIHVLSLQKEGVLEPKPLVNVMNKRFIREKGKTGEGFGWGLKG